MAPGECTRRQEVKMAAKTSLPKKSFSAKRIYLHACSTCSLTGARGCATRSSECLRGDPCPPPWALSSLPLLITIIVMINGILFFFFLQF